MLFCVVNNAINVVDNVINNDMYRYNNVMQNIENSHAILSLLLLMSFQMSLNCTEIVYINDIINNINDKISFQGSFANRSKSENLKEEENFMETND